MSANFDIEFQDIPEIDSSQSERAITALRFLKDKKMIFPGAILPANIIEEALQIKYSQFSPEPWKFLGPFLALKEKIHEEYFFTTSSGIEAPGFKILSTIEMADYGLKKIKKNNRANDKITDIMTGHDISKLDEESQKKYNFVQRKAAEISLFQQKILFKRIFI